MTNAKVYQEFHDDKKVKEHWPTVLSRLRSLAGKLQLKNVGNLPEWRNADQTPYDGIGMFDSL